MLVLCGEALHCDGAIPILINETQSRNLVTKDLVACRSPGYSLLIFRVSFAAQLSAGTADSQNQG